MDFSSTELWSFIIQVGILCAAVLAANILRRKLRLVRDTLMPTAVLAGFILLLMRSTGLLELDAAILETLTYHGIAVGFIALSLRTGKDGSGEPGGAGAKSGALIASCYVMQGILGLVISLALSYTVMPGLFKASGILLPMGYGQGPGQANNIGSSYEALGFAGGRSFGLALAAAGYLCACVVGVVYLNVIRRRGLVTVRSDGERRDFATVGSFQDENEIPVSESVDRLSVQLALVMTVYLATYLICRGVTSLLTTYAPGVAGMLNSLIWGFNFIIGSALAMLVAVALKRLRGIGVMTRQYQNNYLLSRVSGFAFDLMIVAGIASIDILDLSGLWLPFAIMAVSGGAVTLVYLQWICKYIYKGYYYEGLVSMYGMMTGTISSGVLLLRELDGEFRTPAANNLISGSSFAIVFGAPMLLLVGIAPNSPAMTLVTLGVLAVYMALLLLYILKAGNKKPRDGK